MQAYGQGIIHGTVHDDHQVPVSDATVKALGSPAFAVTDESGRFDLNLASDTATLLIRHLGYSPVQIAVDLHSKSRIDIQMDEKAVITDAVVVTATRATTSTPSTYTDVDKKSIEEHNFGEDLPYVLRQLPSVVVTSDAGTGIGYTGIRIRGSDATRVNVTLNGVPYNDSESQGTYWVDIPDIASSAESIQVQRGVGTSTNGAGAFGGSINVQTLSLRNDPYATLTNAAGSFNTLRNSLELGTGLLKQRWNFTGRVSRISSDGYIDRASADLHSYYFSGGFYGKNTLLRAIVFGGKERTYQAWYGVPESRLNNDYEGMLQTAADEGWNAEQTDNLLNSGSRTFNPYTYPDQVDDYQQDHYQVHWSQHITSDLNANLALHFTHGKGYYEEYRYDDELSGYGIIPFNIGDSTISSTDLVRRRWLDNDFYGFVYSLTYARPKWDVQAGGGWNRYDGDHFGNVIWGQAMSVPPNYRYYFNNGDKRDFNSYVRLNESLTGKLNAYLDLQYRHIGYVASGLEDQQEPVNVEARYDFFNPKAGLVYDASGGNSIYASYSIGNREPVRDDFVDNPGNNPKHETLYDLEAGYRSVHLHYTLNINYYFMNYRNQLVLTGAINDVGASIRTNVPRSYRMGVEAESTWKISDKLHANLNLALSRNKIDRFTEVLYDYGTDFDQLTEVDRTYTDTNISFSPEVVGHADLSYSPFKGARVTLASQYVGKQYLDNTSNNDRTIDPYFVNDVVLGYALKPSFGREISLQFQVSNVLGASYESNGYTWGYLAGSQEYRENYYFPQAGRHYLVMLTMGF